MMDMMHSTTVLVVMMVLLVLLIGGVMVGVRLIGSKQFKADHDR